VITEGLRLVEDLREPMMLYNSSLVTERRLVGGFGFEKMGVGIWHI
jgi:hypothetical protein